jgi:uncharacterized protein YjbI with pentapeptide repeats
MPGWMWVVALLVAWLPAARAAEPVPVEDPTTAIEDPRRLARLGEAALAAGDRVAAERHFGQMITRLEISAQMEERWLMAEKAPLRRALVLERVGELEQAATMYGVAVREDPMKAIQVLRILSLHPRRDELVAEALVYVTRLVEDAKAGRPAPIYITSKGEPRNLQVLTVDQVMQAARRGEESQYCYVEDLDFTKVEGPLPPVIHLDRCVVGRIYGPGLAFGKLVVKGIVLGDVDLGKTKKKGVTVQPPTFADLFFRDAVFVGRANFAAVDVTPGRAYFPMAVFEGEADFKGAEFHGVTEFRFASFGKGANFRLMRMYRPVYFGGTRFRADTVFANVFSERDVYFNEATFEGAVSFERCEFQRGATFENSRFLGPATFDTSQITHTFNLSRVVFESTVDVKELSVGSLDALGTHFRGDASFMDAHVDGRARFSLDEVTRHAVREDLDALLGLYRSWQGDEDAEKPITTQSSYGVETLDDLNSIVDGNISFANTVFAGFTVFEGVRFGRPDGSTTASFFNTQFLGETHFERTEFYGEADFTTIFGKEVAFNNARFHRSLVLDDAAISGRLTLTDAEFSDQADLSLYATEIANLQIDPSQVAGVGEPHRLFYERCARGTIDRGDVRIARIPGASELTDRQLGNRCYDFLLDEFIALKDSYSGRAMAVAEDDAYWWARHHAVMQDIKHGSLGRRVGGVVRWALFEVCFGWGVRLENLAFAVGVITLFYAFLYRLLCPDTVLQYNGENLKIRDVPFAGLCYVSLQAMIAVNTGWDFGEDNHRFRALNVSQTVLGFIVLTFFVGAYTRMILA